MDLDSLMAIDERLLRLLHRWLQEDAQGEHDLGQLMDELDFQDERECRRLLDDARDRGHVINLDQLRGTRETTFTPHRSVVAAVHELDRIQAAKAAGPDRVAGFDAWARRQPVLAPLVIAIKYAGPIVGLVGGTIAIVLLFRSC